MNEQAERDNSHKIEHVLDPYHVLGLRLVQVLRGPRYADRGRGEGQHGCWSAWWRLSWRSLLLDHCWPRSHLITSLLLMTSDEYGTGCWLVAGRHTTAAARGVLRLRWLQLVTVGRARETDGAMWRRHGRHIQQETGHRAASGGGDPI